VPPPKNKKKSAVKKNEVEAPRIISPEKIESVPIIKPSEVKLKKAAPQKTATRQKKVNVESQIESDDSLEAQKLRAIEWSKENLKSPIKTPILKVSKSKTESPVIKSASSKSSTTIKQETLSTSDFYGHLMQYFQISKILVEYVAAVAILSCTACYFLFTPKFDFDVIISSAVSVITVYLILTSIFAFALVPFSMMNYFVSNNTVFKITFLFSIITASSLYYRYY
jgi:hypothetical protein